MKLQFKMGERMSSLNESQRIYDYIIRFSLHRDAEWNIKNCRWYLEYARQYSAVCGIPQRDPDPLGKEKNRKC